ncbi:MAG: CHAP domain-containing protein [Ruminococcus sp.]|nr:CHAP domain-containing protein [Ruminococcus sp.]
MSFSIGAALKKIAVSLLTDKKVLKWVAGIVLGIIIIIMIPFAVIISLSNGDIQIDTESLKQAVQAQMNETDRARTEAINTLLTNISTRMKAKKFTDAQIQKAYKLYFGILYSQADDASFVDDLVSCFKEDQTDEELITAVNNKFGVNLSKDAFNLNTGVLTVSNSDIVNVAKKEIGNVGGEKYWRWFGFDSHVHWCACFVSWCADQCGYLDQGLIPRTATCLGGISWFQERGLWLSAGQTPKAGMLIYFDWDLDGLSDHVGIVEKCEGGTVYTIEGNTSDSCAAHQYDVHYACIYGYGTPRYSDGTLDEGSVTGDVATQVWTYLKSYGYSDSVAAGIMGNMMRECGGDTLDLSWNIVGHYNGDEFYGLCQWCLRYTPSGFKNSSIKQQCDYLQQTIASEFAAYGGNYNGITYSEFLNADTRTAAIAFERVYERCGDYANEDGRRANNAEVAYNHFHK